MVSKSLRRKIYLLTADVVVITGAFLASLKLVARPGYFEELIFGQPWYFILPLIIFLLAVYFVQGYHLEEIVTPWRGLAAMSLASVLGAVGTGFLFFLVPAAPEFSAKVLVLAGAMTAVLLWFVRLLYGRLLSVTKLKDSLLIIGTDQAAQDLSRVIAERARSPYRVVGLLRTSLGTEVAEQSPGQGVTTTESSRLIELKELPALVKADKINSVVLGMTDEPDERFIRVVTALKRRGLKVRELTDLYEEITGMTPVQYVGELKMLFQNFGKRNEFFRLGETLINRLAAALLLIISSPIWLFVIAGQQFYSRGPIFVENSNRIGEGGRKFRFYKIRSMVPNATQKSGGFITQTDDPRITPFGRFIRKTHLDELPQLLNILKGDMNFIGPRAEYVERVQELEKSIPYYHERHMIKPGVTGWAQVRNVFADASEKSTLEKIQYDLYYLKHRSLALDLAIVIRTIKIILKGKGIA